MNAASSPSGGSASAAHCSPFSADSAESSLSRAGYCLVSDAVCSAGAVRCVRCEVGHRRADHHDIGHKTDIRTTPLEHHVMVWERQTRCKLTETGTAVLECTTSISRRSFMEIANARRRAKAAVGQPAALTAGFHPKRR